MNYLNSGLSFVTTAISNSDGLKSIERTDDRHLIAVCGGRRNNKVLENYLPYQIHCYMILLMAEVPYLSYPITHEKCTG